MEFPSLWAAIATDKRLIEGAVAPARKTTLVQGDRQRELERERMGGGGSERGSKRGWAVKTGELASFTLKPRPPPKRVAHAWKQCNIPANLIAFHTLNPSRGFVPLVLPPAKPTSVGSQSEMWMSSWLTVPGCIRSGLATNPTPRTPPSHREFFLPRSGQLLPPYIVWPPLSVHRPEGQKK